LLEVKKLVAHDLVITWPSGCMARTFSHHAPAAPARK
jgi:hypothetical protein